MFPEESWWKVFQREGLRHSVEPALRDLDGKESSLAPVCVTGLLHAPFRAGGACLRVAESRGGGTTFDYGKGGGNLKVFLLNVKRLEDFFFRRSW